MTVIKICGIRNIDEKEMVIEAGADFFGINIYPDSKRYVELDKIAGIIDNNTDNAVIVGVNLNYEKYSEIITENNIKYLQLHGDEDINLIKRIKKSYSSLSVIKMLRISQAEEFEKYLEFSDYLLCDTFTECYGGSGKRFDWRKLESISGKIRERLFVAGGINENNIDELLKFEIYGVDIASGSENIDGNKDINKIRKLVKKVKYYE